MLLYNISVNVRSKTEHVKIRRTLLSSWLLICLLLAGQFSLLVHEADHTNLSIAASAPCVFCLSHSTFAGAAPAAIIAIAVSLVCATVIEYRATGLPDLFQFTSAEPRAPPSFY